MRNSKLKTQNSKLQLKTKKFVVLLLVLILNFQLSIFNLAHAAYPVAANLEINDTDTSAGMIIAATNDGFKKSRVAYDQNMVGIIVDTPTIVVHPKTETSRAVISGGDQQILVNTKNGPIKKGDFITSSDIPGVGQKATQNGYVIGIALADFPPSNDPRDQGLVFTTLNIHFNFIQGSTIGFPGLDQFGQSLLTRLTNPTEFLQLSRYLIAALVAIAAILLSFFSFARSVRNGIEAMGRNPLARRSIQVGMIINAFLTAVVALFGLIAAYLIIRFF